MGRVVRGHSGFQRGGFACGQGQRVRCGDAGRRDNDLDGLAGGDGAVPAGQRDLGCARTKGGKAAAFIHHHNGRVAGGVVHIQRFQLFGKGGAFGRRAVKGVCGHGGQSRALLHAVRQVQCNAGHVDTAARQADRQRTDKRQRRKFLGDGFHGETSFRIFTKSVGPAHGNCKRFRTKPRFRSTKWLVRIKKCQEQAVLLAGDISCRGRRPRRPAGNAYFPDDCRVASPLAAAATLLPGNTGTSAPHPALRGHLPPRGKAGKFYPSKFVMLFKLTPRVEALCSRAEVAGGRMPMAPSTIRVLLKLMIKR